MNSIWNTVPLSEIADVRDGTHDSPKRVDTGKLLITTKHLKSSYIDFDNAYFISEVDFEHVNKRSRVDQWDILISMIGTVGNLFLERNQPDYAIKNLGLIKMYGKATLSRFIYYFLLSKQGQGLIRERLKGTTQSFLSLGELRGLPIPIPPLQEQKAIAEVLSSLDDKIELLQQQNETLEALAQTLFRQWFIEEADDSWEEVELVDCCDYVSSGGTPKTSVSEYYDGDVNWFSTKELKDGYLYESEKNISINGLENSSAKLFPENSVLIAIYAAPTVGRLGILTKPSAFNQAACGLVANTSKCSTEFLYLQLLNDRYLLNLMASGTAQQNLNVSKIKSYLIKLPPKKVMDRFNEVVQPLFKKIRLNGTTIMTIQQTRDTLLPKLMSGQVRVKLD